MNGLPERDVSLDGKQRRRHSEAQHPSSLGVDAQFELGGLDYGQVSGLGPPEEAPDVDTGLAPNVHNIARIAHEPANFRKFALSERCGYCMAYCQIDQLHAPAIKKRI